MDGGDNTQKNKQEPVAGWVFRPGKDAPAGQYLAAADTGAAPAANSENVGTVEWTASEFIAHSKGAGWYALLALAVLILAALVYVITRDLPATIVIMFIGLVFGVVAGRKPRVLAYRLDGSGVTIGQKFYPYSLFKSFIVQREGPFASIVFLPMKRFMPAANAYVAPEDEERIMNVLTQYLPLEQREAGVFDSLVRRIRF